jgi:hypothetical protein
MEPNFNIDRPRISDEEIDRHKDFNQLVNKFKQQSLQKAKHDKSWWKDKKVRYTSVIAGITVICTITYFSILNSQKQKNTTNDNITTQDTEQGVTNKEQGTVRFVNAPSKKIIIPYSSYKVNNAKGGEITHTGNSKIRIPLKSFVDKNGKDIIGDVVIEYREFHDKGDIIAGGIPMAYDSAGKKYNLESAGMFDVKGTQNGEPVFIKPGKDLTIELASANAEDRFNQYYLDTVERNWKYIKKDVPVRIKDLSQKSKEHSAGSNQQTKNSASQKVEKLINEVDVILPKKIDSVKIVYAKRAEVLPKPKEPFKPNKFSGRPTFLIEANTTEFPELIAFGNVTFEVGAENKNYSREMHEITWSDIKVSEGPQKGKNYILALTYHGRTEKLIVYPVLKGDDFEKAQKRYEQKFETYRGLVEKREADEKRLMAEMEAKQKVYLAELQKKKDELAKEKSLLEAKMQAQRTNEVANSFGKMADQTRATRIFEIAKFGIYNSDCAHAPEGKTISPVFVLNAKEKPLFPDVIYLVNHDQNSVYCYSRPDFSKIQFKESGTNSFLIFVKNNAYLCNKNGFKESADNGSNKFTVKALPENADNLVDFKNALEI